MSNENKFPLKNLATQPVVVCDEAAPKAFPGTHPQSNAWHLKAVHRQNFPSPHLHPPSTLSVVRCAEAGLAGSALAMDMDDGEGFPIETAKEKILTVVAAPDLRHSQCPDCNGSPPHAGSAGRPGADALHPLKDELVGDDDHREHTEGAERDQ